MLESQEVEEKLKRNFKKLEQKFNKLDRLESALDKRAVLDEVQPEILECKRYGFRRSPSTNPPPIGMTETLSSSRSCRLLKDYEREARLEDMSQEILTRRKAELVRFDRVPSPSASSALTPPFPPIALAPPANARRRSRRSKTLSD